MTTERPTLTLVIPAHNEAEGLGHLVDALDHTLRHVTDYELLVVDDGSTDNTAGVLRSLREAWPHLRYVILSRNFGHQAAVRAGLSRARGRAVIVMDADMQHPPSVLIEMISAWRSGADVVHAVRRYGATIPLFKRLTSGLYYRLLNLISDARLETGAADFYLLDERVVQDLNALTEQHLFLRGVIPSLGYRRRTVPFTAGDRSTGQSSYSLKKMLRLARDGVLSTSVKPLRIGVLLSSLVGGAAALYAAYALLVALRGEALPGWTSIILVVSVIGAMQLLTLGIIGEYLGRVLAEARGRPSFLIADDSLDADRHVAALSDEPSGREDGPFRVEDGS
ncbi:putative glycosyl transferase [Parvularcula bermudensis HTCC2503]|uniref:Putative glycosyl transferase n=1 Tax=Parvularcula bermudensis (strain ATCC BAA-594 / HTCC2503 / KCTC 12087) TaxID=314260 RepID=E0TDX6_PARBH|nr:glycosyltransferase family 2 protein [Parvularcula bermudensis]ADM10425.1 putative glycosyl transferase [Parvularcula bermudensis HTCC2503]